MKASPAIDRRFGPTVRIKTDLSKASFKNVFFFFSPFINFPHHIWILSHKSKQNKAGYTTNTSSKRTDRSKNRATYTRLEWHVFSFFHYIRNLKAFSNLQEPLPFLTPQVANLFAFFPAILKQVQL